MDTIRVHPHMSKVFEKVIDMTAQKQPAMTVDFRGIKRTFHKEWEFQFFMKLHKAHPIVWVAQHGF